MRASIKPEQRDPWLELVSVNAARARAETRWVGFHIGEDLERPNTFFLVERWANMEAQHDHFRDPRFEELMGALGELLAAPPEISIHEVASTMAFEEALAAAGVRLE